MVVITCGARQALEIGADVEVTVVEVTPGEVRLGIRAPGQCVTRLDTVPLPPGASELRLVHLEGGSGWPYRRTRGSK